MSGYHASEIIGRSFREFLHQEDLPYIMDRFQKTMSGNIEPSEYRILTKSGEIRWVRSSSQPIIENHHVIGIRGMLSDITERKQVEQQLQTQTAELEELFKTVPDALIFTDLERRIIKINPAFEHLFGYSPDELHGKKTIILYSDEKDFHEQGRLRFNPESRSKNAPYELRYRKKNGEVFSSETIGTQVVNNENEAIGFVASVRDITERKKMEKTLLDSKEKYRSLFEGADHHIFVLDSDFRYTMMNASMLRASDFSLEEVVGKEQHELYPEDGEFYLARYRQVFETGKSVWFERQLRLPDGDRWFSTTLSPIRNDQGRIYALTGISKDITDRKQMEEALKKREQEFRLIADNVPGLLSYVDTDGFYRFVNKQYGEWFGLPQDEIIGKHYQDVLGETVNKAIKQHVKEVLSGHPVKYEDFLPYAHGGGRWVSAEYVPDTDHLGEVKGFFALITDITERKQAEIALNKSEKRLRFLSSKLLATQENERRRISLELHDEMGQSLTAIEINLMEVLRELPSKITPTIREKLEEAQSMVNHASAQIRELSLYLRPSMLDDLGLVPTVRWRLNRFMKRMGIDVKFEVIDLDERLEPDAETVLFRIIQESLNNVGKHAGAKKVIVRLECKREMVTAIIEDDGKGFDVNEILSPEKQDVGIGLMGMQERASIIGGSLAIESRKGIGTRVSLNLPRHRGEISW
jgi:PAS domain S-box-containing protein